MGVVLSFALVAQPGSYRATAIGEPKLSGFFDRLRKREPGGGPKFRPPGVGSSSEERLLARQIGRLVLRLSEPARRPVTGINRRRNGPGRRTIADAADGVDAVLREPVRIIRELEIKAVRGRP